MEASYKKDELYHADPNDPKSDHINFSAFFPNQASDNHPSLNLPMLIQYIDSLWDEKTQSYPLFKANDLIDLLTSLNDFLQPDMPHPIQDFPDSLYHFLTYLLFVEDQSIKILPVLELIYTILYRLSSFDYNVTLTYLFENIPPFLFSKNTTIQKHIIGIFDNFLKSDVFFDLACANDFPMQIYEVINVSGDKFIIQNSFTFLSNFVKRFKEIMTEKDPIPEILNHILLSTFGFIQTCRRFDLLPNPFQLLKIFFESRQEVTNPFIDSLFLETAKGSNMTDLFSGLLKNSSEFWNEIHPELFVDSLKFLNQYWPECPLFDEDFVYEVFNEILCEDEKDRMFQFIDFGQNQKTDSIQIVAMKVLSSMIPTHHPRIAETGLVYKMIKRADDCSYEMKQEILKFIMDFLTFSPVEVRRQLMTFNTDQTEEAILNLMIESILSQNISSVLCVGATILHMRNEDEDYWNSFLENNPHLIEALEDADNETPNDEVHKIIQLLLANIWGSNPQE